MPSSLSFIFFLFTYFFNKCLEKQVKSLLFSLWEALCVAYGLKQQISTTGSNPNYLNWRDGVSHLEGHWFAFAAGEMGSREDRNTKNIYCSLVSNTIKTQVNLDTWGMTKIFLRTRKISTTFCKTMTLHQSSKNYFIFAEMIVMTC